jgi:hypothetical protein
MLKNILGKKSSKENSGDKAHKELIEKIAKMNLTEMRAYVRDSITALPVTEDGLNEVLRKLIDVDAVTKKRYINPDDDDSKKKKAFDIIILAVSSKKITMKTIELIQQFLEVYNDIIDEYDKTHKDIYKSRITNALSQGILIIDELTKIKRKMRILE